VPRVYDDPAELLDNEALDFVDICTNVQTHAPFTRMAAERGLHVVCQKPMAVDLAEARSMVETCQQAGVQLLINENWRWQYPIRQFKQRLDSVKEAEADEMGVLKMSQPPQVKISISLKIKNAFVSVSTNNQQPKPAQNLPQLWALKTRVLTHVLVLVNKHATESECDLEEGKERARLKARDQRRREPRGQDRRHL
jgi:hypothetical protein